MIEETVTHPTMPSKLSQTLPPHRAPSRKRLIHRRYTNISDTIVKNLQNLTEEEKSDVLLNALKASNSYHLISKKLEAKPRGISRIADGTIQLIWEFWHDNATLSNANTERPLSISKKAFDNNPLLRRIDISKTNIIRVKDKRNIEKYTHQDMVKNETNYSTNSKSSFHM